LEKNGWVDAFATGDEFGVFLTRQDKMVADLLAELGPV
jgi:putative tricarboxylic transport membrane protein